MTVRARWCAAAAVSLAAAQVLAQTATDAQPAAGHAVEAERAGADLPASWTPQPGGLTADRVARRAIASSLAVRAAHSNVDAAAAGRNEAAVAMIPQISVSARYSRLSEITPPSLNFSSLIPTFPFCVDGNGGLSVGLPSGSTVLCPGSTRPLPSSSSSSSSGFSFPVILNNYALNATITVPLTDLPFRLARVYEGAGLTEQARRLDEQSARAQAGTDARIAFYEYLRAEGQLLAAQQGLETAQRHQEDLRRFVEAGTMARVDLLRVEAQAAEAERLVIGAQSALSLAETQLRQRMHAPASEQFVLGEAIDGEEAGFVAVHTLIDRALASRPELQSLERQAGAIRESTSATRAAMYPTVFGQFSVDAQNPNSRFFPASQEWNTTWTATVQAQWSPTSALVANAQVNRLTAQRQALLAQLDAVREGTEIEVRAAYISGTTSAAAIASARRQVIAAEESYRVRRERFQAGSAVSSDLTDAELDLLRARLALVNARVDLREAQARMHRAVGEAEPE